MLNVEAFSELMPRMPRPPMRTWWFYELLDLRNRIHTDDVVAGALSFFDKRPDWDGGFGLSPHAPYSTSAELGRLARSCAESTGMPFMTHLAESEDEMRMFGEGAGPMFEFLEKLGRDMSDTHGRSPIEILIKADALPAGAILIHMNHVTPRHGRPWNGGRGNSPSCIARAATNTSIGHRFPMTSIVSWASRCRWGPTAPRVTEG